VGLFVLAGEFDHWLDSGEFRSHHCRGGRIGHQLAVFAETGSALRHLAAVPGYCRTCFYGNSTTRAQREGARHLRGDWLGVGSHVLRGSQQRSQGHRNSHPDSHSDADCRDVRGHH
jgi:hypothetical protein